ncbi:unnamed protein product [Lactuca virosa]|uniref:Retrotransposon gag domain-containing protein n=1 Tax=Lactuca virosa TaxID=75947 RepID=A0AAU9NSN2_9ASTR|nr:unnamed protein product [Lactuca virosa]
MMSPTLGSRVHKLESRMGIMQTEIGNIQSEFGSMKEDMQKIMKRLKVLVRNVGDDRQDWILRAEHHFSLNHLTNEERIEAAVVAFKGDAIRWFQWENKKSPMIQWEDMKLKLLKHFGITGHGSLFEKFLELKQEGTVADYRRKFVNLAAPLEGISEEVFLSQFMNGLQPMIKDEVRLFSPTNVSDAMDIACRIEEKNNNLKSDGNAFDNQEEVDEGVLAYLRFPPNYVIEKGIHINELAQKLKLSHDKLMESITRLEIEGKIYSSIDEFHYKPTISS